MPPGPSHILAAALTPTAAAGVLNERLGLGMDLAFNNMLQTGCVSWGAPAKEENDDDVVEDEDEDDEDGDGFGDDNDDDYRLQ